MTEQKGSVMEQVKDNFGRFMMATRGRAQEVIQTIEKMKTFDEWCGEFCEVARKYEDTASTADDADARCDAYLLASAYYHIAQWGIHIDNKEKKEVYGLVVSNYQKALPYLANPTERVEIPFENISLPGYFRKRKGVEKAPCVILIGGADSSKEVELHMGSEGYLAREVFTLAFDGPGQGETRFSGMYMRPDYEKAVSAALDYLETRPDVDNGCIGVFGPSFGGYLAARAAASDSRIRACASTGGFYGLDEFDLPAAAGTWNIMGNPDKEQWARQRNLYTLKDVIDNLRCPLLVVNGSADAIFPVSQCQKIYQNAKGPKEIKIYEGAVHCANDRPESRPFVVDWMVDKLR